MNKRRSIEDFERDKRAKSTETVAQLIRAAKDLKAKAEQAGEKFYIELGRKLAELKQRKPKDTTWPAFVREHFDYSQQRADELIRIASGTTTVEKLRKGKRVSVAKAKAKKSTLASVGSKSKNNVVPFTKKPDKDDCNYDDGDPDHVDGDTPEMTRRQIFLNMAREWAIKRPTEVLNDAFFDKASPEEATDDLFVEIEKVFAAWTAIATKLKALRGLNADNGKVKVKA